MPWDSGIIEEAVIKVLARTGVEKVLNGRTPSGNETVAILTVAVHALARYCAEKQTNPKFFIESLSGLLEQAINEYKAGVIE